jgi:hypothetical protein
MDVRTDGGRRLDLHNISIDFAVASAGRCGFTHLASGRVCLLPHRHQGPCRLEDHLAAEPAASSLLR